MIFWHSDKNPILFFVLLLFLPVSGLSQGVKVTGKVSDQQSGEPLPGASITLYRQADSLLVAGTVTDTAGMFELKSVPEGTFVLEVSFIGFYLQKKPVTVTDGNINLGAFLLVPSEILLGEVTVTARKSALVNDLDKKVYNVEEEIITNPSARYRPDGVGGIINIVMKKESREGLNGQVTANVGTEKRYSGNVSLNYGTGDLKLFWTYGLRHNAGNRLFTDDRMYKDAESGALKSHYNETGSSASDGLSHNLFAGGSYDINDFNTIELSGSYFLQNTFHSGISEIVATDSLQNPEYSFTDRSTNDEFEEEGEMSFAFEHIFKNSEDHSLSFEAAYSAYDESEDLKFSQEYSFPDNQKDTSGNLVMKSGNQQEILLEYALPFGEEGEFESGYAGEFVREDIRYTGEASTSRFLLNSQVHALYALLGMPLEDFTFKAGLRAEQAFIDSHLKVPVDTLIPNNYFKLFPTLHLGYSLNDNHELSLSYSKRINRPDADDLNPNPEYSDPRNAEAGNPTLKPEQIHSLELGYMMHHDAGDLTATLYYRYKYDAFTTIYSSFSGTEPP